MTELNKLTTEEAIAAGVVAKFDADTGEFLGYESTEGDEVAIQSDEDLLGFPGTETVH